MSTPDIEKFEKWAGTYEQSAMQRLYFRPVHVKMLELLSQEGPKEPPRCIIDVGCGTGRLLRAASAVWPEAQLFGVDPARQMLSEAARLTPNAAFKLSPAESLPFPDGAADIVLSSLSFHHWADQQKGLAEIARVLRPGGLLCLADHSLVQAKFLGERVRSRKEILTLMTKAGLSVRCHRRLILRLVLITLARKELSGSYG